MRILLARLRPIGDVVFTTPLLGALRRHHPEAHLSYLVEPDAAPVLHGNTDINDLIVVPRRRGLARLRVDLTIGRQLARRQFDVAIDLHGGPRSAWFTWTSQASERIGYSIAGRTWMYTRTVPRSRQLTARHSVMNQWDLLEPLGIPPVDPARDPVRMADDPHASAHVAAQLAGAGVAPDHALIVMHVSASTRFKRWPEPSFVSLIVALVGDPDRRVLLISGPSDRDAAHRVADAARTALGHRAGAVLESWPMSLAELRALIDRAALFIGGDSGPLHIAATTAVPIVELLGPTLAQRSFPWRHPRHFTEIVEPGPLPCRPCHQRTCLPGDFRCLTGLAPDRVLAAAERALRSANDVRPASPPPNERRISVVHR